MTVTTQQLLCHLQHIGKVFRMPSGAPVKVLDDVSLEVHSDEILAILGPSGCGKSTLMRILAGLIPADEGKVLYHGEELGGLNPGVAIVFQGFGLFPWLTVLENILEALRARGADEATAMKTARRAVTLVGLAGFEDAYPRELSGGMRQRAGLGRAVSVEPEILCMDEPFSQVDALTAETLRGEVVRFWSDHASNPRTILMVSHDVKEVVFMATRIVVLAARPGRIRQLIDNPLPYPRDPRSPAFQALVDRIHAVITETELPDEPAAKPSPYAPRSPWEPLPDASPSEIVGLMEVLEDRGGTENVFELVEDLGREFGKVLNVVKAAELLDFVDTPRQDVVLSEQGRLFLASSVPERKRLFGVHLLSLRIFADVLEQIRRAPNRRLEAEDLLGDLMVYLPYEAPDQLLQTIVKWGLNADLFDFDSGGQVFFLAPEEAPANGPE